MFTSALYLIAFGCLILSYCKNKQKTITALKKGLKAFLNVFPAFAGVLALVGLTLTLLTPDMISMVIGSGTGFLGMFITSIIGSITLIPGFVAFPLAASLLEKGAGTMQIAVFISTLMMVGFVTMPLESKYFGKKETILRNSFSYIFSFVVAVIIGVIAG
jgi:uncharacterized membrane protein YraQ (UPF0718 family)